MSHAITSSVSSHTYGPQSCLLSNRLLLLLPISLNHMVQILLLMNVKCLRCNGHDPNEVENPTVKWITITIQFDNTIFSQTVSNIYDCVTPDLRTLLGRPPENKMDALMRMLIINCRSFLSLLHHFLFQPQPGLSQLISTETAAPQIFLCKSTSSAIKNVG